MYPGYVPGAIRGWKLVSDAVELELQCCKPPRVLLGTELGSYTRAASALRHCVNISLVPGLNFCNLATATIFYHGKCYSAVFASF